MVKKNLIAVVLNSYHNDKFSNSGPNWIKKLMTDYKNNTATLFAGV